MIKLNNYDYIFIYMHMCVCVLCIYVCRCMHTNKSVHGICLIQFSVDKFEGRLILLQTCKHEDCMCMCIWAILQ